jgi:hypothetical protein
MREWNSVLVSVFDSSDVAIVENIYATFLPHKQKLDSAEHIDEPLGISIQCTSFVFSVTDVPFEFELGYMIKATINGVETEWHGVTGQDGMPSCDFDKHKQQIQVMVQENDY